MKKLLSLLLSLSMLASMAVIPAKAEETVMPLNASRIDSEKLPSGNLIYLGTASANVKEEDAVYSFPIYREGDLSEEASVTIHSLDLTAIYGEDYIILDDNAEKTGDGVSILERYATAEADTDETSDNISEENTDIENYSEFDSEMAQQFADEVLKGKYEYVISTHVDKNHIHNHIIFNAASFVDHHKYVSNKRSYHKLCRISNRICHENGLVTSMPTGEKGKSYKENMEYHRGTSWKAKLRVAVDKAIWTSINYEEFLQKMQLAGYEVRQGKHLSFRAPEQKNFTYIKSLGNYYSEENVRIRLAKNRNKVKTPRHLSREARLYINISTYVTTGNREGFERWAKLNNLKEAARTFNYLSENNLLNYEDFQQHVSDIEASVKAADQKIVEISNELTTQKVIQKHCDSYRLCRKVIEDCKFSKNPKAYRTKHQTEYQLHDSLKKELQDLGVTKIPSSNKIQKRIENLESEQDATVREKQELQKKQKTLEIIQQNFTALLDAPEISSDLLQAKRESVSVTRDK